MSKNIIDAIFVALGLDTAEYKKGIKEAGDTSQKFAKDEEKRDKARQDSHKKLTEAERSAAKERSRQEKERDVQAREAVRQINAVKNSIMGAFGVTLGAAGVVKFFDTVVAGNAELYRTSRLLKTEMKSLDVWGKVAEKWGGSRQGVIGALAGIQQAKAMSTMGLGGQEQMQALGGFGVDPADVDNTDRFLLKVRNGLKGLAPQMQVLWLARAGLQDLLPIVQMTDDEFKKYFESAQKASAKTKELGADAQSVSSEWSEMKDNLSGVADTIGAALLPAMKDANGGLKGMSDWVSENRGSIGEFFSFLAGTTKLIAEGWGNIASWLKPAGDAIGEILNKISGGKFGELIGKGVAEVMAKGGSKEAQEAIRNDEAGSASAPSSRRSVSGKIGGMSFRQSMRNMILDAARRQGVANPEVIADLGARQSALETGNGSHAPGNNYFGIKGGSNSLGTKEFINGKWVSAKDSFRGYKSQQESADDYVKFLLSNKRYAEVLKSGSIGEAISAMGSSGYATDPDYAQKLAAFDQTRAMTQLAGVQPAATNTNSNNRTTEVRIDSMTIQTAAMDGRSIGADTVDGIRERVSSVGVY